VVLNFISSGCLWVKWASAKSPISVPKMNSTEYFQEGVWVVRDGKSKWNMSKGSFALTELLLHFIYLVTASNEAQEVIVAWLGTQVIRTCRCPQRMSNVRREDRKSRMSWIRSDTSSTNVWGNAYFVSGVIIHSKTRYWSRHLSTPKDDRVKLAWHPPQFGIPQKMSLGIWCPEFNSDKLRKSLE
jgi:hypothetical protein